MKKKLALLLAVVMVFGITVGATLAWLSDSTPEVKNTFTVGDIKITLTETWNKDTNNDGAADAWEAQLLPGKEYEKDPVVAVDGNETNVDCYLFVKFEEKNNPATYLTYTSTLSQDKGWTKLEDGVWYRIVYVDDDVKSWNLLEGDKVTVKNTLKKGDLEAITNTPELVYTAYAIQLEGFEDNAADAWAKVLGN